MTAALAFVPNHDGATDFVVVDALALATEAAGPTVPENGADEQALGTYFTELSGTGDAPVAAIRTSPPTPPRFTPAAAPPAGRGGR